MIFPIILAGVLSSPMTVLTQLSSDSFGKDDVAAWVVSPPVPGVTDYTSTCGRQAGNRILGGFGKFKGYGAMGGAASRISVQRTIGSLPPHWNIQIEFKLFKIDGWEGPAQKLRVLLDGAEVAAYSNWTSCSGMIDICGARDSLFSAYTSTRFAFNDQIIAFRYSGAHTASSALLSFDPTNADPVVGSWGIREFKVTVDTCHSSCATCQGPNSNECLSCYGGSSLTAGQCGCSTGGMTFTPTTTCGACAANQFTDPTTTFCTNCPAECTSCTSSAVCTGCSSGYYPAGPSCTACIANCATCSGAGTCASCATGYAWSGAACVPCTAGSCTGCRSGFYLNVATCLACTPACQTCSTGSYIGCDTCVSVYYKHFNSCLTKCPKRMVGYQYAGKRYCGTECPRGTANVRNICKACHSSCATCAFAGDSSQCLSCPAGLYFSSGSCVATCPSGTAMSVTLGECVQSVMINWKAGRSPGMGRKGRGRGNSYPVCQVGCGLGTYYSWSEGTCLPCRDGCTSCNQKGECRRCRRGGFRFKKKCVRKCKRGWLRKRKSGSCASKSSCDPGTFAHLTLGECADCHPSCGTCRGPSVKDCITAAPGFTIVSGISVKVCPASTFYCPDIDACVSSCSGNFLLTSVSPNTFTPCQENCVSCTSATSCSVCLGTSFTIVGGKCTLACTNPLKNLQGACVDTCPGDMFSANEATGYLACFPCDPSCSTCFGPNPNHCLSCNTPLAFSGGSCSDTCPSGQILVDTGIGFSCSPSCPTDSVIVDGVCEKCDSSCATCTDVGEEECLSCHPTFVLNIDGTCTQTCIMGSFLAGGATTCTPCPAGCASCIMPGTVIECLACNGDNLLDINTNACRSECAVGDFTSENSCNGCPTGCVACSGVGACTSCESSFYFLAGNCVTQCPITMYPDSTTGCMACFPGCYKCKDAKVCLECKPGLDLLAEGICACSLALYNRTTESCQSCVKGYFAYNNSCVACHVNCETCTGPLSSECISCKLNRGDTNFKPVAGICECWQGYTNMLNGVCNITNSSTPAAAKGVVGASTATAAVVAIASRKAILLYKFADFAQSTGSLTYMNVNYPGNSRDILNTLNNLNLSPLQGKSASGDDQNATARRGLLVSPIAAAQGKTELFLTNAAILIGLTIFSWASVWILGCNRERILGMDEGWGKYILVKLLENTVYAFPIQIFLRTYMDGSVNMFIQLASPKWNGLGIVNFICALIFLGYMIFLLAFFVKKIDLARMEENVQERQKYASLVLEMGTGLSKVSYFWTLIQCLRKFITAGIVVLLFSNPTLQVGLLLAVNAGCLAFCLFFNPYNNFMYRILAMLTELTGVTLMGVLLAYQLSTDPLQQSQMGSVVEAHLLMQIGIQFLFISYFVLTALSTLKKWVMDKIRGEEQVGFDDEKFNFTQPKELNDVSIDQSQLRQFTK